MKLVLSPTASSSSGWLVMILMLNNDEKKHVLPIFFQISLTLDCFVSNYPSVQFLFNDFILEVYNSPRALKCARNK